jgi:hypothetical protein
MPIPHLKAQPKVALLCIDDDQDLLECEKIFLETGFPLGAFKTLLIGSKQVYEILNDPRVVTATLT